MPDFETTIASIEESLRHFGQNCKFQKTGSPNILCTTLPSHWRSNKSLPSPFVVLLLSPVADGTKVTVTAGNEENDTADVKNHVAEVTKQVARFSDLRFVGKSGRGKNFNLTITIHHHNFREITVVPSVIKVTVDGPRDSRNASKCHYNPFNDFHRKRQATLASFDLSSMNLGHSIPSTSGLFDLTNSSPSKRPRLNNLLPVNTSNNNNNSSKNNKNNNILQNPIISNGNEFFKSSQISMPPSFHPQQLQQLQHHQSLIFPTNLMMAAAAAVMSQQQQQQHPHLHLHQPPHHHQHPSFIQQQQQMYNAYLTLCAAALSASLNPPSSSEDTASECGDIKSVKKMNLESCKTATPSTTPEHHSSPQETQSTKNKETKVWRPFLSTE
uniref:Runt domain-containing protein n=1 Tax=Panagrolaimus superbus TaxID=310955 RepID=A0A914YAY4_9BILA